MRYNMTKVFAGAALLLLLGCTKDGSISERMRDCWASTKQDGLYEVSVFDGVLIDPTSLVISSKKCPGFRLQSAGFSAQARREIDQSLGREKFAVRAISGSVKIRALRLVAGKVLEAEIVDLQILKIGRSGDEEEIINQVRQR